MVADRASIAVGESASFAVLFDNSGLSSATGTTLVATLPPGTTLVPGSTTGAYDPDSHTLTWALGDLAPSVHGAVNFAVIGSVPGLLTAQVLIDAAADASTHTTASASVAVTNAGVRVAASVDRLSVPTGNGTLNWTVVVTNDTTTTTTVGLVDLVPANTTYVPGTIAGPAGSTDASDPSALAWSLTLDPGESATLRFATTAPSVDGLTTNSAGPTTGPDSPDSPDSNDAIVLATTPTLPTLRTTASTSWVAVGGTIVVTIDYSNPGEPLTHATLRQRVGDDFAIANPGTSTPQGPLLTWSLGALTTGASGSVTFTLDALEAGPFIIDRASLTSTAAQDGGASAPQLSNTVLGVALACELAPCTEPGVMAENEGCTSTPSPDGAACADDLPCTEQACQAGACVVTVPTDCDDGNLCTNDTCNPSEGCRNDPVLPGVVLFTTTCGEGACAENTGVATCVNGNVVDSCNPFAGAMSESCNGLDDDCDGQADTRLTTCGSGDCANTGTQSCEGGVWGPDTCVLEPNDAPEVCNGRDDDCDGSVDEGIASIFEACALVGGCAGLIERSCIGGDLVDAGVCTLAESVLDLCNGLDDDCDGSFDENFVPEQVSCGEDACATGLGMTTCEDGVLGDTCDALWNDIPDTTCGAATSGLNVTYIIVTDASGAAIGSVRCYQDLDAPNDPVVCDTAPNSNRAIVYPELLCEGVTP
jgi:uncharacterized repeat protein (TIGR01451 family)